MSNYAKKQGDIFVIKCKIQLVTDPTFQIFFIKFWHNYKLLCAFKINLRTLSSIYSSEDSIEDILLANNIS